MKRALLFSLAFALAATSVAHADIGVVVTGEATLQPQLAAQVEGWLKQRGHTVIASSLEPDAINTLIDCFVLEDLGCARKLIESRAKSQTIVFARVEITPSEDGTRTVSIVGYWLQKGHDAIAERRICQRCIEDQMRTTAEDLLTALASEPPVGSHVPVPDTGVAVQFLPPSDDHRPSRLIPGTVIGAGVALAITGGILIGINQSVSPVGPQQPQYRDSQPAGIVVGLVGVAAIGAGIYLWFHQNAHSAPVAAVTHDGAVVGWTGRF